MGSSLHSSYNVSPTRIRGGLEGWALTTQDNTMTLPGHGIDISPSSPSPFSCPIIVPRHALVGEASPGKAASDAELRSNTPRLIPPGKQTNKPVWSPSPSGSRSVEFSPHPLPTFDLCPGRSTV